MLCRTCNNTGTELIRIGRYVYDRRCNHTKQLRLFI